MRYGPQLSCHAIWTAHAPSRGRTACVPARRPTHSKRLQHIEPRGAPGGQLRGEQPGERGHDEQHGQRADGDRTGRSPSLQRERRDEDRADDPDHEPEDAPDQRCDHRLVADHLTDLATRGADRAQHPQLAGALVDRQHQRVDDPEQARRSPTARAARRSAQQRVDLFGLFLLELARGRELRLREGLAEQRGRRAA